MGAGEPAPIFFKECIMHCLNKTVDYDEAVTVCCMACGQRWDMTRERWIVEWVLHRCPKCKSDLVGILLT